MKKLSVVLAGSGRIHDLTIEPGTTCRDILGEMKVPDYLLSKGPNEPFFANADTVYDKVVDGQKLYASSPADVGSLLPCA
jgi:hypothetical protein